MLKDGIISSCLSPYSSSVILVPKKDGEQRSSVDYKKISEITENEPTTIPIIQDTLRDLGKATIFSTINLKSDYW